MAQHSWRRQQLQSGGQSLSDPSSAVALPLHLPVKLPQQQLLSPQQLFQSLRIYTYTTAYSLTPAVPVFTCPHLHHSLFIDPNYSNPSFIRL